MQESLEVFGILCNMRLCMSSTIILLLNKHDLFIDCLKKESLSVCFSEKYGWKYEQYNGPNYNENDSYNYHYSYNFNIDDNDEFKDVEYKENFMATDRNNHHNKNLLSYFPADNEIVQQTLNEHNHDERFVECYRYSLSFIIKQYIQVVQRFQIPIDASIHKYRNEKRIHVHVIDAMDQDSVKSFFDPTNLSNEWNYQRLIWIGYHKNDDNDECFFNGMPKDIIQMILALLKTPLSVWQCAKYDDLKKRGELWKW